MPLAPARSRRISHVTSRLITLALAAYVALGAASLPLRAGEFDLPKGPNRALVYAKCRTCHDLQYVVESKGLTADAWDGLLDDMEGFGVELTADERQKIHTYLSTYMGDRPAPAETVVTAQADTPVDGGAVFSENCTSCHQNDARGIEETFPPLAENRDLFLSDTFPAKVLLNGMSGTITVNGNSFEGEMPSFAHLSDVEIAAVVNYLRSHFGNNAAAHPDITKITADTVSALRKQEMDPTQVLTLRASLK